MEVIIHQEDAHIDFIYDADTESNRFFRVEMDILKTLGYINSAPVIKGTRRLSMAPFRRITDQSSLEKVEKILASYCLVPTYV